ncbi:MAG TPA: peptide ABC transporter substrate-binding protein [Candidatus Limnocylindria bacterium]|jgi:peptide/nickel transport system substrate-binding protein|nr:peptide ABC transporter substrate-binding protein [Candidatus Limnocylindria bacterium]
MTRLRRLFLSLSLVSLVLGACAPSSAPPAGGTASTGPTRGGTLIFALWQEPETLNPLYATQTVNTLVNEIAVEGLTSVDPNGEYVAVLAREVPSMQNGGLKVSADGKRMDVTYRLVQGVKWSDSAPFTSADVKFTWDLRMRDPKVTSRTGYDKIEGIDTPDELTVVVRYKETYAAFPELFGSLLPKHLLDGVPDLSKHDYTRRPLGTGPFRISEFIAGDHITAERNSNYRVRDRPLLDKVIFKIVPSREAAIAQLKAGEIHGMWNVLEAQVPDLEKDPSIKVSSVATGRLERLEFNLAKPGNPADPKVPHPVLGDLAVRRALLLATPKQQIIDKLLYGQAKPGRSALSIGWAASKDVDQEGYDPAKAKQVLDQAGWLPGPDGVRAKDGIRASLRLSTTSGDKVREDAEQLLVTEWKNIGIEAKIQNSPSSVFLGTWAQNAPRPRGDFDIAMYASTPDLDPQVYLAVRFQCAQIPQTANNGAGRNVNRFCDPQADKALDQAGATLDLQKRKEFYAQFLRILNDSVANVWIYNNNRINAFRANVGGYRASSWDEITGSIADWDVRN